MRGDPFEESEAREVGAMLSLVSDFDDSAFGKADCCVLKIDYSMGASDSILWPFCHIKLLADYVAYGCRDPSTAFHTTFGTNSWVCSIQPLSNS